MSELCIAYSAWAADLQQTAVFEFHPSHAFEFGQTAGLTVLIPVILFVYLFIFNTGSKSSDSAVSRGKAHLVGAELGQPAGHSVPCLGCPAAW